MKNTKRNVIISAILTIALCCSLIVGGTFAWFTDTAKVNVNKVVSGTLDVELQMKNDDGEWVDAEGETLSFLRMQEDGTLASAEEVVFEPGATYQLPALRVANKGKLALKYKVYLTGATGDLELLDVLSFYMGDEVEKYAPVRDELFEDQLMPGETSEELRLVAKMDKNAGNEYQDLTLENVAVSVYATQAAVESDSTGSDYDADAKYPIDDFAGLKEAITAGGLCEVNGEVVYGDVSDTVADRVVISEPTMLQLNDMIKSPDNMGNNETNFAALYIDANTTINANINGGIDTGRNGAYGMNVRNGAKLVINGGYYYGGGTAVQVQKGELEINGGFFACEPFGEPYLSNYLINCIDSAYKDGTAKVSIKGGTFVNFNPADNTAEGKGTNFLAEGYAVVSEKVGDEVWYTVVPADEINEAFAATNNVLDDTFVLNGGNITIDATGKTVTNTVDIWDESTGMWSLVSARGANTTLTIDGGNWATKENDCYAVDVQGGANVVIKDGNFIGNITAIYVYEGSLTIEGGFFDIQQLNTNGVQDSYGVLINCYDANRKEGKATIVVKGGTFVNFNPADNKAEGAGTNFVADGYKVVSEAKENGEVWYTVVKA